MDDDIRQSLYGNRLWLRPRRSLRPIAWLWNRAVMALRDARRGRVAQREDRRQQPSKADMQREIARQRQHRRPY